MCDIYNYSEHVFEDCLIKINPRVSRKKKTRADESPHKSHFNDIVLNFPISHSSKEILTKMIATQKIIFVNNFVKVHKNFAILHAHVNLEIKNFAHLKSHKIAIKIYRDANFISYDVYGYRRKPYDEKKVLPPFVQFPVKIDTDKNFTCEPLIIFKDRNVILMKRFEESLSLTQIVEDSNGKIGGLFEDILLLIRDVRERDDRFWRRPENVFKKIICCNGEWTLISSIESNFCYKDMEKVKDHLINNISALIEQFYIFGLSKLELERIFGKIFNSNQSEWKGRVYFIIYHRYFKPFTPTYLNKLSRKFPKRVIKEN